MTIPIELREETACFPEPKSTSSGRRRRPSDARQTVPRPRAGSGRAAPRARNERLVDRRDHGAHARVSTRSRTVLVDSNVLLDVLTDDPQWGAWSSAELATAADTNHLRLTRSATPRPLVSSDEASTRLPPGMFTRLPLPCPSVPRRQVLPRVPPRRGRTTLVSDSTSAPRRCRRNAAADESRSSLSHLSATTCVDRARRVVTQPLAGDDRSMVRVMVGWVHLIEKSLQIPVRPGAGRDLKVRG